MYYIADQGILKFDKPQTTHKVGESSTTATRAIVESSTTNSEKKEMVVDYHVYNELPDSVRQELVSDYNLKFEKAVQNSEHVPSHERDASIPELPPWSQLDPESLLALPNDMRDKLIKAYRDFKNPPTTTKSPPRSSEIQKKTPPSSVSRNTTFAEVFSPTSDRLQKEDLPYDANVWNELPSGK